MYDLIIIGAGVAGISSAIYASRVNLKIAIIEKDAPGGKLLKLHTITNYPGYSQIDGIDLALKLADQLNALNVDYLYGDVLSIKKEKDVFIVECKDNKYEARSVIVASGSKEQHLNVPGEEEFKNKGVSYCATCDGVLYKNKKVAIALEKSHIEEAYYLSKIVDRLYVINPSLEGLEELEKVENITLVQGKIIQILGQEKVESIIVEDSQTSLIEVDGVFVIMGSNPISGINDKKVLDSNGYLIVNELMETAIPGLFGAGDIINKNLRQIVTAASDGAIAATSAIRYLK